jgi:hypothetical protein
MLSLINAGEGQGAQGAQGCLPLHAPSRVHHMKSADDDDDKPVWPTLDVVALLRGVRCIQINRVCLHMPPSSRIRDILVQGRMHTLVCRHLPVVLKSVIQPLQSVYRGQVLKSPNE